MLFRCCNEIRNIQAVTVRMTWQHEYNWLISIYFVWKKDDWIMKLQVPPNVRGKKGSQIRESAGADTSNSSRTSSILETLDSGTKAASGTSTSTDLE